MFILRPEHEAAITQAIFARFKRRAAAFLHEKHPDRLQAVSNQALDALIESGCRQARSYGLSTERQLVRFLRSSLLLGDPLSQASRYPALVQMARDLARPAEERSAALLNESMRLAAVSRAR